jgi:hypothetical protein
MQKCLFLHFLFFFVFFFLYIYFFGLGPTYFFLGWVQLSRSLAQASDLAGQEAHSVKVIKLPSHCVQCFIEHRE